MTFNITRFVGHLGNHNDEFVGGKLVRDRGQRKWGEGVSKARWRFVDDPNKYNPAQLTAAGELPIGICGWPYDEHGIPNAREKFICAARMVYDHLGIANDFSLDEPTRAAYQSVVRYAMYADCKTGVDWQALPNLIKRRWSRYFAFQGPDEARQRKLEELVWRCEEDVNDFFEETVVFWQALFGIKDTIEQRDLKVEGQPVKLAIIRRDNLVVDNPQVKNALTSWRWGIVTDNPSPDVIFKRTSNGQFGIFTTDASKYDLSEVVIDFRLAEMAKRGIVHNLTREELLQERCELCPTIHYMKGSQTVLNGSKDSARGVEASLLEDGEIEAILADKIRLQKVIVPKTQVTPDHLELPGPVKAALANVPGPSETVILLVPGEDGVVPVATF